jgi:hypothetical protein
MVPVLYGLVKNLLKDFKYGTGTRIHLDFSQGTGFSYFDVSVVVRPF